MKLETLLKQITPPPYSFRINMVDSKDHLNGTHAGYYIEARESGDGHYWRVADVFGQKDKNSKLCTRHGYDESNAAYLVHCANLFPELVKALEDCVEMYADVAPYGQSPIVVNAKQALTRAKEIKI